MAKELLMEQVREAWRRRRMHEAARLSRQAARCRFGARHRDGRRLGIVTLSKDARPDVWKLEGRPRRRDGHR
eukprot:6821936-Pyramimonas_sp.AAC.1